MNHNTRFDWAVSLEMWLFHLKSPDNSTPQYGWWYNPQVLVIDNVLIVWAVFVFVTCITELFCVLKFICQVADQSTSLCKSDWRASESLVIYTKHYKIQSSAKRRMLDVMSLPMSLTYNKKRSGPSTVSWGTPDSTITSSDNSPSTTTFCFLPVRQFDIQLWISPLTP